MVATAPEITADPAAGLWPTVPELVMIVAAVAVLILFFRRRWNDLQSVPLRPNGFAPAAGIALFIGFLALQQLGAAGAAKFWGIDALTKPITLHDQVKLMSGVYAAQFIALLIFGLLLAQTRQPNGASQGLTLSRSVLVGALAIVLCWPVLVAVGAVARPLVILITSREVDPIAHESLRLFLDNPVDGWFIALAAMVVVVTPVVEEVMYRGVLQTLLVQARLNRWLAIGATSAVFASAHGSVQPHALPLLFVLSMAFGLVYERTGRLASAIVMHALFNAANLLLTLALN